jgi:3'-5' exoribonuclease
VFREPRFFEQFCDCPASQSYNHAYLSGLLEHTVSVATTCAQIAGRYDGVDRDLLISAALMHDIGKVDELSYEVGIGYSDVGRLVGHVVASDTRVRDAARRVGLETRVLLELEHAILSHHGELEWGSPKRPATFEALLLHHVDNLDAKASGFSAALKGASSIEENWTDATNLFRRPLYAPRPIEDERRGLSTEDAQHFQVSA